VKEKEISASSEEIFFEFSAVECSKKKIQR